jgi:hypothetical protein
VAGAQRRSLKRSLPGGRGRVARQVRYRSRGQALVELALLMPVLVMLTLGVVDGARVFGAWVSLTGGVRQAALYASVEPNYSRWCSGSPSTNGVACPTGYLTPVAYDCPTGTPSLVDGNTCADPNNIAYRIAAQTSGLDRARITLAAPVCTSSAGAVVTCDPAAANVTISATYQIDLIFPGIKLLWGQPVTLGASATAPVLR